jgi:Rad52/22 family double-strand break repair protein
MTKHPDLFAALAAPFESHELKARSQQGRQLHYITARTVMNRLDSVLGPENWWDEYVPSHNSVLCRLTIRLPDGSTLTKCDAGGYAGLADSGDDGKSGYSDAFKRAAVKFGVGRHLYRDGIPTFTSPTSRNGPGPEAPEQARPAPSNPVHSPRTAGAGPRTGRALFAWTKEQEQRSDVGLLKYLNNWAKLQEFPSRMVEWDADQVSQAYDEACRKLDPIQSGHSLAFEVALAN